MSNSYRKPIIKEKPRNYKRTSNYWRRVRRVCNQSIDINNNDEPEIPNRRNIINDYDYCDWIWDYRYIDMWHRRESSELKEEKIKLSRK